MKWFKGIRTVAPSALKLSGTFKQRLAAPHVQAMAASTGKVGRINLPAVCWKLNGVLHREVAAGEDRVAASLIANGMNWDAPIEVRTFDGDEQDVLTVRAHENAHRRHDNRDEWLAGLARAVEESTQVEDDAEGGAVEPGEPGVAEEATGNPGGEAAPPEALVCNLDGPDGGECGTEVGEDGRCANGHDWSPAAVFAGARLLGVREVLDPPDNIATATDQALAAVPAPLAHASDGKGGALCGVRSKGESVVGEAVNGVPVTCGGCNKLLRKPNYKAAAALATETTGKPVSANAVRQAAYRDRKAKGQVKPARQKHVDGGEPMGPLADEVGRALLDVHRFVSDATTRLANLLRKHPLLGERQFPDGVSLLAVLQALKDQGKAVKATIPEAVCVFCFGKGEKAPCQACRGFRFVTKQELKDAPAELRKAAGL